MKNEIVRLKCVDMSVEGQGICKKDGLVVFVKGMITGEIADVKIIAEKKNMSFGIIDKMIEPSPYRIEPKCPIAYKCGGCDYRHIDYKYQLEIKKKMLENTFRSFNLNLKVNDVIGSDNPEYYRNKTQVPLKDHKYGFYRKNSNDIVEFDECYIETRLAGDILKDLKKILSPSEEDLIRHIIIKHCLGTGEVMIIFVTRSFKIDLSDVVVRIVDKYKNIESIILNLNDQETNVVLGYKEKLLYGRDYVIDEFEGLKFKIASKSFYQVNYHQMIKLYSKARELANLNKEDRLLDLYSGIGTISLFMAKYVKEVTGVEIVEAAVNNAKENALINGIDNATFYLDDAKNKLDKYFVNKDVVVVDPPRKGLSDSLIETLHNVDIKKVIYISCNPATLARDLAKLQDVYEIKEAYPVDMFAHTTHVETVCLLINQNAQAKHHVNVGIDAEDYYKIKEGK